MQGYIKATICLIFSCLLLPFCNLSESSKATLSPSVLVNPIRYEQLLVKIDTSKLKDELDHLLNAYPAFSEIYFSNVLEITGDKTQKNDQLLDLIRDTSFQKLVSRVDEEFNDMDDLISQISQGLINYSQALHLPGELPAIYTYVSGFVYQCFVFDDLNKEGVGIGLDMFLGSDFPYGLIDPGNPMFSTYMTRTYNRDHVAKKVLEVLVEDKLPPPAKNDFLSLMIWGGKKLYMLDELLPFVQDTVIFEYTPEQLAWCQNNEAGMWGHFFEQDLFYSTDVMAFQKLIAPAPYSPGMPDEAPGQTGNYMGYRIVEEFMDRNPNMSLSDLLRINDAQYILDQSKFKPRL